MKKVIQKVVNSEYILIFVILSLIASIYLFDIPLVVNDELWNFSNMYKMTKGFEIYQDLNVIITPLFFYIGSFFLKFFGNNYLIYRLYNRYIINVLLFLMVYKIFRKLEVEKWNAIIYTTVSMLLMMPIIAIGGYGILATVICLIGIEIEIKGSNNLWINSILQGLCTFLIFMTKQNIGVFYLLGLLCFKIMQHKPWREKTKSMIYIVFLFTILIGVFCFFMKFRGNLEAFLNYTLGGINEFAKQNLTYSLWILLLLIVEIIINIIFIKLTYNIKIKWKNETVRNRIRLLASVSFFMIWQAYPIVNISHVMSGSIIFIILFLYLLDNMFLQEILEGRKAKKIKKAMLLCISICILILSLIHNILYIKEIISPDYYFEVNSPYYGALAKQETVDEIHTMCQYIEEQNKNGMEVKVISYYANLYMNVLGKNNGEMDLPFYGNMGKSGEEGMIQQIKELRNTKILILTQEDSTYQESKKVTDYIRDNFIKEGEISRFTIYASN